jgi:hypothetical protein
VGSDPNKFRAIGGRKVGGGDVGPGQGPMSYSPPKGPKHPPFPLKACPTCDGLLSFEDNRVVEYDAKLLQNVLYIFVDVRCSDCGRTVADWFEGDEEWRIFEHEGERAGKIFERLPTRALSATDEARILREDRESERRHQAAMRRKERENTSGEKDFR